MTWPTFSSTLSVWRRESTVILGLRWGTSIGGIGAYGSGTGGGGADVVGDAASGGGWIVGGDEEHADDAMTTKEAIRPWRIGRWFGG